MMDAWSDEDATYWQERTTDLEYLVNRIHAAWCVYNGSRDLMDRRLLADAINEAFEKTR